MFGRVLFPTDFSAYADSVFTCLPELKVVGTGQAVLAGIIRETDGPGLEVNQESLERVRWSVEEQLNIARKALKRQGLRVTTRIEYGSPAAQIVRVAKEERVSLIVIGAQGRTLAQEVLLGSVAHEVMRRATVPVLVHKFQGVRELGRIECRQVCEQMFTRVLHTKAAGLVPECPECHSEATQQVFHSLTFIHSTDGGDRMTAGCGPDSGPGCCG